MGIYAEKGNGLTRLHIDGEMTIYTAAELKNGLIAHWTDPDDLEIDLSGVSEMDSAGLQLLILSKRETACRGKDLHLTGHSAAVLEVLEICNLAGYFGDPLVLAGDGRHR